MRTRRIAILMAASSLVITVGCRSDVKTAQEVLNSAGFTNIKVISDLGPSENIYTNRYSGNVGKCAVQVSFNLKNQDYIVTSIQGYYTTKEQGYNMTADDIISFASARLNTTC